MSSGRHNKMQSAVTCTVSLHSACKAYQLFTVRDILHNYFVKYQIALDVFLVFTHSLLLLMLCFCTYLIPSLSSMKLSLFL